MTTKGEDFTYRSINPLVTRRDVFRWSARAGAAGVLTPSLGGILLAACGSGSSTTSGSPGSSSALNLGTTLSIGRMLPVTGSLVAAYAPFYAGLQIAIDEINSGGGIGGARLGASDLDDQGTPAQASVAAQRAKSDGLHFVVGPTGSSLALAMMAVLNPAKVINFPYAQDKPVGDPSKYPYSFQLVANTNTLGSKAVTYLYKAGFKKIAYLIEQGAYSDGLQAGANPALQQLGGSTVHTETYPPTATDLHPYLQKIKDSGADGLCLWQGAPNNTAKTLAALADLQYFPAVVAAAAGLWTKGNLGLLPAQIADKTFTPYYGTLIYQSSTSEIGSRQLTLAKKISADPLGSKGASGAMVAPFYDGVYALQAAIVKAGSTDADAVKAALESTSIDGVLGKISFSSSNHSGIADDQMGMMSVASLKADTSMGGIFAKAAPSV